MFTVLASSQMVCSLPLIPFLTMNKPIFYRGRNLCSIEKANKLSAMDVYLMPKVKA